MKVLIVEDQVQIAQNVVRFLSLKNISCDVALDGKEWFYKALQNFYDVIILDVNLPGMMWDEVLKQLREKQKNTQILMLTSNSLKSDIILTLNLWADDYMTKPFDFDELLARLQALNRRNLQNKSHIITFQDYILDLDKTELKKWNQEIKLSSLEFNLLKYFAQNPGKTLSRQEIYEKVWGEFDWDIMFSKTIEVYIWYVRKKLSSDVIITVKWMWYKFWY